MYYHHPIFCLHIYIVYIFFTFYFRIDALVSSDTAVFLRSMAALLVRSSLSVFSGQFSRLSPSSVASFSLNKTRFPDSRHKMFTTGKILSKEQMEELQKNPFFDKYAEKIAQLQK